jgi:hypothetical protein
VFPHYNGSTNFRVRTYGSPIELDLASQRTSSAMIKLELTISPVMSSHSEKFFVRFFFMSKAFRKCTTLLTDRLDLDPAIRSTDRME